MDGSRVGGRKELSAIGRRNPVKITIYLS